MNYSESLKKHKDFQHVYKNGSSYANKYLVIYIMENQTEESSWDICKQKSRKQYRKTPINKINPRKLPTKEDMSAVVTISSLSQEVQQRERIIVTLKRTDSPGSLHE